MSTCCRDKGKCGRYCAEIVTPEVHLHSTQKLRSASPLTCLLRTLTASCSPGCSALPSPSERQGRHVEKPCHVCQLAKLFAV